MRRFSYLLKLISHDTVLYIKGLTSATSLSFLSNLPQHIIITAKKCFSNSHLVNILLQALEEWVMVENIFMSCIKQNIKKYIKQAYLTVVYFYFNCKFEQIESSIVDYLVLWFSSFPFSIHASITCKAQGTPTKMSNQS